jgi:hypothetical protein
VVLGAGEDPVGVAFEGRSINRPSELMISSA